MDAKDYTVGTVAGLTGVSVRTLHHYDETGLLRPSGRTAAGYRLYSPQDLQRLRLKSTASTPIAGTTTAGMRSTANTPRPTWPTTMTCPPA